MLIAAACVASPPAAAAVSGEAIAMAWDDCPFSQFSFSDKPFTCSTNMGVSYLFCAFSLAQPIDQVVGLELVVDLQHSSLTLPEYWQLGPIPDCRHDLLSANLDFSLTDDCEDPAFAGAAVQDFLEGQPRGLASQARIKIVVIVPSPETRSFAASTPYLAVRLALSNDRSAIPGACDGCLEPACLVFNSVLIRRSSGSPGGDITVTTPAANAGNWVTWRGGVGANCALVPTRNRTWGWIKTMYR